MSVSHTMPGEVPVLVLRGTDGALPVLTSSLGEWDPSRWQESGSSSERSEKGLKANCQSAAEPAPEGDCKGSRGSAESCIFTITAMHLSEHSKHQRKSCHAMSGVRVNNGHHPHGQQVLKLSPWQAWPLHQQIDLSKAHSQKLAPDEPDIESSKW